MSERLQKQRTADPLAHLAVGGEMGERIRAFDWSKTPMGPVADWSLSLKTIVRTMLDSRYAMWLGWGSEFTFFYNDAYARMTLGPKHPWALGRAASEVWSEIWTDIGPRAQSVIMTGRATWDEGLLLFLERRGFREETYHTFSYSPVPDDDGGVGGMLCVVTEDTERTIGERRLRTLRELAARTNNVAKSVDDACETAARTLGSNPQDLPFVLLYLLDDDKPRARLVGRQGLEPSSPACPAQFDLDQAPWPFRQVADSGALVLVDDLSDHFGPIQAGAWPEQTQRAVVLPIAKPGQTRPAGFAVAGVSPRLVFTDDYRGFLELLAGQVATAIANARAYEEERRRTEALAELSRAKTTFFSNVSHEFRTPLTLILGPVEDALAGTDADLPPSQRERLEVVHRNGLRLQRLVNTLLDFSRVETGPARASYAPVDLSAFTADLASNFRSACEKAGLELKVDCHPLTEPVFVDQQMWEKVVLNLLSNAFKFTFEGEIDVTLRQVDHAALVQVRDTGTGIPAEEIPRLFDRFHRVENARGRTHEGSGIGLALVHELVKLHGGSVTAQSEVGRGTTFIVTMPLGSAHLPPEQIGRTRNLTTTPAGTNPFVDEAMRWLPEQQEDDPVRADFPPVQEVAYTPILTSQPADGERPLILIADDNADMRRYVARLLAGQYTLKAVPDGEAALAAVRRRVPDLILCDVMMPRLDGFGLLRELRSAPRTSGVPVIMLSARAGEESRLEGMEAGADDYLVKPFSARELLARVGAVLQINRLRRESDRAIRQGEERERSLLAETATANAKFRAFFDQGPIFAGLMALDGTILEANRLCLDACGYTKEDVIGKKFWECPWWSPSPRLMETIKVASGAAAAGELFQVEMPYFVADGSERMVDFILMPIKDESGRIIFLAPTGTDITDRKQAEAATHRQSAQLRQLAAVATRLNSALDVSAITGIVTEEARSLIGSHQAVTGFTTDQNWGQAINRVSLSEKYVRWRDYDARPDGSGIYSLVCGTNTPVRMTQAELLKHPAVQRFGAHEPDHPPLNGWLAAPLVGRDGRNLGLIQVSDKYEGDFTAEDEFILVQLAQMASVAIENANLMQHLRDGDRRKDEFLATLAHELRNPLAPIRNGLQIMRLSNGDRQSVEQAHIMMERQLGQMVHLVDDLLDLSRISRGMIELRKERVELSKIVQQAIETSLPAIEQAGHALTITMPPEPVFVDADSTRLSQVFANLLNNAAKYTERGGQVRLDVKRQGDEAVVSVQDNGVGIPAHMLAKVFEMFAQVDRNLERSQGGLGIGLSIVKRLVEMHGGSVTVLSEGEGMGSEFVIRMPAILSVAGEQSLNENQAKRRANRRRILVVDDNRDAALSLAMMLKLMGNETQTAYDGLEALAVSETFRPELILLDIGMPRLNGYDTARQIRKQPWGRKTFLIALTGWGQDEDRQRSRDAGFDLHMTKPVDPAALEKLLADFCVDMT
jgi:PAS domain S-box-containing protein